MYLLQSAFRLGNINPSEQKDSKNVEHVLESQFNLLDFYRSRFRPSYEKPKLINSNNNTIKYMLVGDAFVGKKTFSKTMNNGHFDNYSHSMVDFIVKAFAPLRGEEAFKHQIWDTARQERYLSTGVVKQLGRLSWLNFLICFAMNRKETLDDLDKWFEAVKEVLKQPHLGIILGLYSNVQVTEMVNPKEAVKKAFGFRQSIFVQANSKDMKNVFTPFWFVQLQFTYFQQLKDWTLIQEPSPQKTENNSWNCTVL